MSKENKSKIKKTDMKKADMKKTNEKKTKITKIVKTATAKIAKIAKTVKVLKTGKKPAASKSMQTKKAQTKELAKPQKKMQSKTQEKSTASKKAEKISKIKAGAKAETKKELPDVAAQKPKERQKPPFLSTKSSIPAVEKESEKKVEKKIKKSEVKKSEEEKGAEFEEDFLTDSEDRVGDEELPDLSEFEESEEESEGQEDEVLVEVTGSSEVEDQASSKSEEVILTDAEGRRYCRVRDCDQIATVEAYCRYHYLLLWKKIQIRRGILLDGKLERYIEELTSRYPDKFLEVIRKDMRNEKDFLSAIQELEIDESANENEFEDETQGYIDEVRGMTEAGSSLSEEEEF